MVATHEQSWGDAPRYPDAEDVTVRATGGQRYMLRNVKRFFGASLMVAALAFWVFPVANGSAAELLCKLMVTVAMGFAGAALWQAGSPMQKPELEIDLIRREVRLVRSHAEGKTLITRRRFCKLQNSEFHGLTVRLWDDAGDLLAELTMPDQEAADRLQFNIEDSRINLPWAA